MAKRWIERHESFQRALGQLTAGLAAYPDLNELEKDGAILRFKFTFELAWKTLQDYLAQEAGHADVKGPRVVIKQAIQDGLLTDGHLWLQMLIDRNELMYSHDGEKRRFVLTLITVTYVGLLTKLNTLFIGN
ncbi:HI0074 family nucleotidyltransferase substrate-binding subunit [Spirosoma rhododendri]|uniref:Nucleotidyltransferase n=1 Tax=Spirosoma rhododendri TaxID=2728024 RepID=A0A7L5DGU9_9BACT|nr:HI0074 family nucleotidyltransferase substrate-binding subunit [Spirosoma rhododendri]QJD77449.1 nucleotidyltransferase [Spirosoma rhododendri]